jgi:hypothetical protein
MILQIQENDACQGEQAKITHVFFFLPPGCRPPPSKWRASRGMPRMVHFAGTFRVDAVNQTRYAIPQMPAIAVYFERDCYCVSTSSAVWHSGPSFVAIAQIE